MYIKKILVLDEKDQENIEYLYAYFNKIFDEHPWIAGALDASKYLACDKTNFYDLEPLVDEIELLESNGYDVFGYAVDIFDKDRMEEIFRQLKKFYYKNR